jgi:serine/threonine protein kinase/Tol biopolymer transport system component
LTVPDERWSRVKALFQAAVDRPAEERAAFLAAATGDDAALRREVESLLASDSSDASFLDRLPVASESVFAHPLATLATSHTSLAAGLRVGPYEVIAPLGAGAMGEVYSARDTKLNRIVALKVLPQRFALDPERAARFTREAQLLATLNHPNIAALYGLEESSPSTASGQAAVKALVMELVDGPTLADRIVLEPISLEESLTIARQIAEALEAAHEKGIIHRDLKPANIKVAPSGTVKVLDFGLAKVWDGAPQSDVSASPTLTATDPGGRTILGTPAYMSPEQARGQSLDRRTDIWSFGCVLYEMLTGRTAFAGDTISDTLAAILEHEPEWAALPNSVPAGVRTLLRRCLEKDVRRRLRAAGDAALEIDDVLTGVKQPQDVFVTASRNRERFVWIAATLLLSTLALTLGISYLRTPASVADMRVDITTPSTDAPTSFAISPDGRRLVFVAYDQGQARLWLRPLDATTAQPLAGTEGAMYPFWSPDSRALGFFADAKLKRIDIRGGVPQTLASAPAARGGTWNADGLIVFTPSGLGALSSVPSRGGDVATVTTVDRPHQASHLFPQFLPDGRRFLFFVQGSADTQGVYLGSLDSPKTQRLTSADSAGAYLPPGWVLFLRQGTLVARRFDSTRGELTGDPITVADPVGPDVSNFSGAASASRDGIVAYRSIGTGRRQLTWFDRAGKLLGTVGVPDDNELVGPSLSPDGLRIAAHRTLLGNTDIWIFDAARATRFTFDASRDLFPIWSPDGRYVAFDSNRSGHRYFYRKQSDLAGAEVPFLETPEDKVLNDWSPDGQSILYVTPNDPRTGADIWYLRLSGDRKPIPFVQTPFLERAGQFSPDGQWVAYHSNETGRYEVYVRSFPGPGGQQQVSTSGGIQARWRSDGQELYYIAPDGKLMAVSITMRGAAIEPGTPVALFQTRIWGGGTNANQGQQYDVSKDGRFLLNTAVDDGAMAPITLLLNFVPGH